MLLIVLGAWVFVSKAHKEKVETIDRLLKEVREQVDCDTYPSYQAAAKKASEILEQDSDSIAGHADPAYIEAIRYAEHGEGIPAKQESVHHVDEGLKLTAHGAHPHSHILAAEAYLKLHGGDPAGAQEVLKEVLSGEDASQSPFLTAVLGAVELDSGDLDAARETLTRAQKANPGDARTVWLLAEQYRRRGEGYELQASGYYDYALRIEKEHVPSILGKALVLLGRGQVEDAEGAAEAVLSPQVGASAPQQALARAIEGGVLAGRGKPDGAAAQEAEAAKLDPTNPDLPWLVGIRKLKAQDAAGAVEAFQCAVALDNKRVSLYADRTRALLLKPGERPRPSTP